MGGVLDSHVGEVLQSHMWVLLCYNSTAHAENMNSEQIVVGGDLRKE